MRRHHLHPSALRVPVPRSDHGLGEPACAGLAAVEHPRRGLLRRSPRRRAGPPWPAGDLQHRPGRSQFTNGAFTGRLQAAGIQISMDGRGRCMDNIFIERLWRSLKYEAVYLHELADGLKARRVIGEWIGFYTTERPHSALGGRTPAERLPRRPACGYDGHAAPRRAHIPTGSRTPARQPGPKEPGGMINNRNTP